MWIKFTILYLPFLAFILWFAPGLKWKVLFALSGMVGIYLALIGKSMKGLTPVGRRYGGAR